MGKFKMKIFLQSKARDSLLVLGSAFFFFSTILHEELSHKSMAESLGKWGRI
jgi:hypothetical protein